MDTSIVFIDTCIFINKNYHFDGNEFQSLIRLTKENKIRVVTTEITIQEVKSHIEKDIENAIQVIQKTRKQAQVLRNFNEMPLSAIFEDIYPEKYQEYLQNKFEAFLESCGIETVSSNTADIDNVFKLYFEKKPPFGERKKKSEFPDAFVLDALNRYAKISDEKIYVISQDRDFAEGVVEFKNLIYLSIIIE